MNEANKKIIAILGPSSTGKSELAIKLAKHFNSEIISVDSRQIYREINIGTAKPSETEKQGIKHHLMDFLCLREEYTVAQFADDANSIIKDLFEQGKTPILAGGTGLYFRVLLQDFDLPRVAPDINLRNELEKKTNEELFGLLKEKDGEISEKIHPNNRVKVIRALEVILTLNKKMSEAQKKKENPFDVLWIGLDAKDRGFLYERANLRVDKMMKKGLLDEVKALFEKYPNNKILTSTIGYQEFLPYFSNTQTLDECVEKLKQNTRNYIKRQLSWFRANKDINWLYIDEMNSDEIFEKVLTYIE
ncbi:tRNA (adenosine(37)-N6)-dimethylallyltransferase MiaA [bacterium]|nr:tRNA (adenosine(37)-N6)-dimethylallyltransferase MiaA [bacterium]